MKITVLGATGCVGSATAFFVASAGICDELVLLARRRNVAEHHAIDLETAFLDLGLAVRSGDWEDLAGSDLIINAAGLHQDLTADRAQMLVDNVKLIAEIAAQVRRYCPDAVIINASNPIDALNYAMWRAGGFARQRLLGYSLNDTFRFRQFVARIKGVDPRNVEAIAIGEHGKTQVPLFSSVRIDGAPVDFTEEEKAQVRAEYPRFFEHFEALKAGRTSGWTCAVGLTNLARAVAADSGALFAESAILDGEYGQKDLSMGVPVRVGRQGVKEIVELPLAADEEAALERSLEQIKAMNKVVDGILGF